MPRSGMVLDDEQEAARRSAVAKIMAVHVIVSAKRAHLRSGILVPVMILPWSLLGAAIMMICGFPWWSYILGAAAMMVIGDQVGRLYARKVIESYIHDMDENKEREN